jgi:hypothetical protein
LRATNVEAPKASSLPPSSGGKADFRGSLAGRGACFVAGFIIATISLDYAPLFDIAACACYCSSCLAQTGNVLYPALTPRLFRLGAARSFSSSPPCCSSPASFSRSEYFMLDALPPAI